MIHPEYSINPGTPEDPPHVQTADDVAKNGKHISFGLSQVNCSFPFQ